MVKASLCDNRILSLKMPIESFHLKRIIGPNATVSKLTKQEIFTKN